MSSPKTYNIGGEMSEWVDYFRRKGAACPRCGMGKAMVRSTRDHGTTTDRRHICKSCGFKFWSVQAH